MLETPYELARRLTIERNQAMLSSLGISDLKKGIGLGPDKSAQVVRKRKLAVVPLSLGPPRRSSRLTSKGSDLQDHSSPPSPPPSPKLRHIASRPRPTSSSCVTSATPTATASASIPTTTTTPQPLPTRDADGAFNFLDMPDFRPNLSPKDIIRNGSFGGTFFARLDSAITGQTYVNDYKEFPADWFSELNISNMICSETYQPQVNRYGVKAGQSLQEWEKQGWVATEDPRGWFQWYCRFFLGRRSDDDERQISRWLGCAGPNGRFKKALVKKCLLSGARYNDESVSPVVRQTLQHWAYQLTEADFNQLKP